MTADYVESLTFDMIFEDNRQADGLRRQLHEFCRTDFKRMLSRHCQPFEADYLPLEELEIDLGTLDVEHFYSDLKKKMKLALEREFHRLRQMQSGHQTRHSRDRELTILKHFLQVGRLPWNSPRLSHAELFVLAKEAVRESQGSNWLYQELSRNGTSAERFVLQFNDDQISELLSPAMSDRVQFYHAFQPVLAQLLASFGEHRSSEWRNEFWLFLFRLPSAAISREALVRKTLAAVLSVSEDNLPAIISQSVTPAGGTAPLSVDHLLRQMKIETTAALPAYSLDELLAGREWKAGEAHRLIKLHRRELLRRIEHFSNREIGALVRQVSSEHHRLASQVLAELTGLTEDRNLRRSIWQIIIDACINGDYDQRVLLHRISQEAGLPPASFNLPELLSRAGEELPDAILILTVEHIDEIIARLLQAPSYSRAEIKQILHFLRQNPEIAGRIFRRDPSEVTFLLKLLRPQVTNVVGDLFDRQKLDDIVTRSPYSRSTVISRLATTFLSGKEDGLIHRCLKSVHSADVDDAEAASRRSDQVGQLIKELMDCIRADIPFKSFLLKRLKRHEKRVILLLTHDQVAEILYHCSASAALFYRELEVRYAVIAKQYPQITQHDYSFALARAAIGVVVTGAPYLLMDLIRLVADELHVDFVLLLPQGWPEEQVIADSVPPEYLITDVSDDEFIKFLRSRSEPVADFYLDSIETMPNLFQVNPDLSRHIRRLLIRRLVLDRNSSVKKIIAAGRSLLAGYVRKDDQSLAAYMFRLARGEEIGTRLLDDIRQALAYHHQFRLHAVTRLSHLEFTTLLERLESGRSESYRQLVKDDTLKEAAGKHHKSLVKLLMLAHLMKPRTEAERCVADEIGAGNMSKLTEDFVVYDKAAAKVHHSDPNADFHLSWVRTALNRGSKLDHRQRDQLESYLHDPIRQKKLLRHFGDDELVDLVRIVDRAAARNYEKCRPYLHILMEVLDARPESLRISLWTEVLRQRHKRRRRSELWAGLLQDAGFSAQALIRLIENHSGNPRAKRGVSAALRLLANDPTLLEAVTETVQSGRIIYYEPHYATWRAAFDRYLQTHRLQTVDREILTREMAGTNQLRQDFVDEQSDKQFTRALRALDRTLGKVYQEAVNNESFLRFAAHHKAQKRMLRGLKLVALTQLQSAHLPSVDELLSLFFESYLEDYYEFAARGDEPAAEDRLAAIREKRHKRHTQIQGERHHELQQRLSEDRPATVVNAGIILLGPFIGNLFNYLKYTENDAFVSDAMRLRALFMIHYLATGEDETCENDLLLPKVLCGMEPDDIVPSHIALTDEEKQEGDDMLQAAINLWDKLRDTTPPGLRLNFLQRQGVLTPPGNYWVLQIERQTPDILLDFVPWTFNMVKFPWMDKAVQVIW